MKKLLYLFMGLSLVLTACDKDEDDSPNDGNTDNNVVDDNKDYLEDAQITDFYPITTGNSWTYKVRKYELAAGPASMIEVGDETVTIGGTQSFGGKDYIRQEVGNRKDQIPELIRVEANQIQTTSWTYLSLYVGKTIASGAVDNYGQQNVAVRRMDGEMETPAGKFGKLINRDTQFDASDGGKPSLQLKDVYSKGVGRIYFEDIDVEGCLCNGGTPVIYTYTLTSYNVQ